MYCISIDIDWAHDAVISDTLELIEQYNAKATWFITHRTPLLEAIRCAGGHELGLHPNFNPLLDGQPGYARETLERLQEIVPDALSVRSHSLVSSSRLSAIFRAAGLTHESNYLLPPAAGKDLSAWRDFSGLIKVPIRWEDDVRLIDPSLGEPLDHLHELDPFVVDFHPIHVFLNTTSLDEYERARDDAQNPQRLLDRRRPAGSGGSRDRLVGLLEAAQTLCLPSCRVGEIQPASGE